MKQKINILNVILNFPLFEPFRIAVGVGPHNRMVPGRALVLFVFVDRILVTLVDASQRRTTLGLSVTPKIITE